MLTTFQGRRYKKNPFLGKMNYKTELFPLFFRGFEHRHAKEGADGKTL